MNLQPIQILLVILMAALIAYVFKARNVLVDRTILLVSAVLGGTFVVYPELSTRLANAFGVGRGTDLILYLFMAFCLFRFVSISSDLRKKDRQFTEVIRHIALEEIRLGQPGRDQEEVVGVIQEQADTAV